MEKATLHIKNMVCSRCMKVVKTELENLGLHPEIVRLGEVVLQETETKVDKEKVKEIFSRHGLKLLDDKKSHVIEKIKSTIIELIHHQDQFHTSYNLSYLMKKK